MKEQQDNGSESAKRPTGNPVARYAAYGSNLHPMRLLARTPSAQLLGTGLLQGWQLVFHKRGQDGSGKCNIRPGQGHVFAAVYQLNRSDMEVLDAVEGVNLGYQRSTVSVPGHGDAHVYLAEQSHLDAAIRPFCWYRELVLEGCRYHEFPDYYVAQIQALQHDPDPDEKRRALHARLLREIANCKSLVVD